MMTTAEIESHGELHVDSLEPLDELEQQINDEIKRIKEQKILRQLNTLPSERDDDDASDGGGLSEETKQELRSSLKQLDKIDHLIQEFNQSLKKLRMMRNKIKNKIIDQMNENNIGDANLNDDNKVNRYMLRECKRKENPLAQKRLPTNLAYYFEHEEKLKPETALNKAQKIIKYITDNLTVIQMNQTLYCRRGKK
jgi:hypothetical protein